MVSGLGDVPGATAGGTIPVALLPVGAVEQSSVFLVVHRRRRCRDWISHRQCDVNRTLRRHG